MAVLVRCGGGGGTQELVPVACLSGDVVGDVVCMRDVLTLTGRWRVQRADPTQDERMPGVGVLVRKETPTTGVMQRMGIMRGVVAGMSPVIPVFIGSDGRLTQVLPVPDPGGTVIVQRFGIAISGDTLFLTGEIGPLTKRRA